VYYKARDLALNNNHTYHLVAYAKIGSSYLMGINSDRNSAKFKRRYQDGTYGYHLHAEMDLIRQCPEGSIRTIRVVRFRKNGNKTMSMPCRYCQRFLREHGVVRVHYTNWEGEWEVMRL
jgi:deoxycytidylate deaminase